MAGAISRIQRRCARSSTRPSLDAHAWRMDDSSASSMNDGHYLDQIYLDGEGFDEEAQEKGCDEQEEGDDVDRVRKKRKVDDADTESANVYNTGNELVSRQMVEHLLSEFAPSVVLKVLLGSEQSAFRNSVSAFVYQASLRENGKSAYFWNDAFQEILSLANSQAKFKRLRNLAHDFTHAASVYGRIIISERFLPVAEKTIKPLSLGGTAGGLKYICGGVMFKFCVDVQLSNGSWMYGGEHESDERAMKSGGHELKAIINLLSLSPKNTRPVHFPMMAVVDYRGFRLLAESLLPIDNSTLIYGSSDGGINMHATNSRFNASVKCLAEQLNLAEHQVGSVYVHAPGDIEGHRGRDGRFYLIDLARVFPPQAPVGEHVDKRHVFYEFLRPEFVRNWTKKPLCSDAFTRWQAHDPRARQHNKDVIEATEALLSKTIPNFASELPQLLCMLPEDSDEREHARRVAEQIESMLIRLHNRGINTRHLGIVLSHITDQHWAARMKVLSEMTARVLKNIVRSRLREKMRGLAFPGEEPYRQELITYLNLVLGNHPESNDYWTLIFDGTETVNTPRIVGATPSEVGLKHSFGPSFKFSLLRKYGRASLTAHVLNQNTDLRSEVGLPTMMIRLVKLLGVVFTDRCLSELHLRPNSLRLVGADLVDTGVRVKHMGIVNLADARALHLEARQIKSSRLSDDDALNEVDRLLLLARRLYNDALASMPDNFDILSGLAGVLYDLSLRQEEDTSQRHALLDEALTHYAESLRAKDFSNNGRHVLVRLVRVLCELASSRRTSVEEGQSLCAQAAVYAEDAMSGDDNDDDAGLRMDNLIRRCLGAPKVLDPNHNDLFLRPLPDDLQLSISMRSSRGPLRVSTELTELPQAGRTVILTWHPPTLFVSLMCAASNSDTLRTRVTELGRAFHWQSLQQLLPAAAELGPDAPTPDWLVERLDLSDFAPHVTMDTLRLVKDLFPYFGEVWLLPSRRKGTATYAISTIRQAPETIAAVDHE